MKNNSFYKNILDQMVEAFVLHAADGSVVDYNIAACNILGVSSDQLLGKTSMDPQ